MQLVNAPSKLVLPFASAGAKNTIPVASQIGITAGAASLTDGFPPLTRTPLAGGGVPPSGLDMNGILYELSAILRWTNAGGGYPFDGTFAADSNVGGYPKGARVMRSDGLGYWFNTADNNTTDPEGAGAVAAGWVPDYTSGTAAITMTSSNVTLTALQWGHEIIVITGTLTADLNLIFPAIVKHWIVVNNTTGAYSITAKTAAGTGVTVAQSAATVIYGDGTNIGATAAGLTQAAADARYLQLSGGTLNGPLNLHMGADIASAATLNLSTATGNTVHVTGTTTTTGVTMNAGQWVQVIADAAWPLTYHATNLKLNTGGANYTCAAGDSVFFFYDGTTVYAQIVKADGTPVVTVPQQGPAFSAYQNAAQTLPALTWTKISQQAEDFDTDNCFDTSNSRFTPNKPGYYDLDAVISQTASSGNMQQIAIYKNGAVWKLGNRQAIFGNYEASVGVSCKVYLNGTTDYVELWGWSVSGVVLVGGSEKTYFQGVWVRP